MSFHQIDEDALLDYAGGALDPARRAEVAALLAEHPELQTELDELRRLQRGLRTTFDAADLLPAPRRRGNVLHGAGADTGRDG